MTQSVPILETFEKLEKMLNSLISNQSNRDHQSQIMNILHTPIYKYKDNLLLLKQHNKEKEKNKLKEKQEKPQYFIVKHDNKEENGNFNNCLSLNEENNEKTEILKKSNKRENEKLNQKEKEKQKEKIKEKNKEKLKNGTIVDLKNELFKKNINFNDNSTSNENVFTLTFSINKNDINNEFIVSYDNETNIKSIILMGNNGNLKKCNFKKIYSLLN